MSSGSESFPSQLVIGFRPGDSAVIGGVACGVDVVHPALVAPDGSRLPLADDAVLEVIPGLYAQAVDRPRLGPLAIAFWGRGDISIVRRRAESKA